MVDRICCVFRRIGLLHHKVVIHRFRIIRVRAVGHRQGAVNVFDLIGCGHIIAVSINDLRFARDVRALTDQGLGPFHFDAVDLVAFGQFAVGQFVSVIGQRFSVIDLLVACRRDLDRDLFGSDNDIILTGDRIFTN